MKVISKPVSNNGFHACNLNIEPVCIDIDECLVGFHECNKNAACSTSPVLIQSEAIPVNVKPVSALLKMKMMLGIDINECQRETDHCDINESCTNGTGDLA